MLSMISRDEQKFIRSGIEDDIRQDGRTRMDYRDFSLKTGVLAQASGSSMLQLGHSRVLVATKVEIGSPDPNTPNWGQLKCSVDWCRANSTSAEQRIHRENLAASLARRQERALRPSAGAASQGGVDLASLCIIPGVHCWVLYIDVMILGEGGNLADAISLGTRAALHNTKIPKTNLIPGEFDGEMDFELSEDPLDCQRLDMERIPICVSLTKIGDYFVIDPTLEEEYCMNMQLTVAVDKSGNFCSMSKSGPGAIDPSGSMEMLQSVRKIAQSLISKIDQALVKEETSPTPGGAHLF